MRHLLNLAAAGTMLLAASQAAHSDFLVRGPGSDSCGQWTQQRKANDILAGTSESWILGYVTRADEQDHRNTSNTAPAGLFAWVDNYCFAHPLDDIIDAVNALVEALKAKY